MAAPLQMASAIFLLATKVMCAPSAIKAEQNTSSTKHNIPELESENTVSYTHLRAHET